MADSGLWVALIGVGGTLMASVTTGVLGNRAQRRGDEMREREQVRQLEAAQLEREHAARMERQMWLRERREAAYNEYVEQAHASRTAFGALHSALRMRDASVDEIATLQEESMRQARAAFRLANRVSIVGPAAVAEAGAAYLESHRKWWADLDHFARAFKSQGQLSDSSKTLLGLRFKENTDGFGEAEGVFVEAARTALES
ncbi:hypothetical protein ACFWXO_41955 [Kitasatospora sp. NPDC059088]|uniref:hypothetical protein n=1 Tax=Kitasatospora sp. NPDC059088 TaxID=3346722 RepID=UPI0036811859